MRFVVRYDSNSSGTKEVQRTMLELLNQLDGFDERGDVKVIMATNRIESLDPALIRPGRIDRKIEFPLPDIKTKRHIFNIHTGRMTLSEEVDLEVRLPVACLPVWGVELFPLRLPAFDPFSLTSSLLFIPPLSSCACLASQVFVMSKDDLSGADIKAVCSEAGLLALRERRMRVTQDDFIKAKERALYRKKGNVPEGLYL